LQNASFATVLASTAAGGVGEFAKAAAMYGYYAKQYFANGLNKEANNEKF
jgi:hypothetical protein